MEQAEGVVDVAVVDDETMTDAPAVAEILEPLPAPVLLTAAEILDAEDLGHVDVPVPEWTPKTEMEPRCVRLLEMSAGEAVEFTDSIQENAKSRNKAMVNIIRLTAVDANGVRLFEGSGVMEAMMKKSFRVYQRLSDAALVLNGFTPDTTGETGDDAAKND